jgi:hypothetical protein
MAFAFKTRSLRFRLLALLALIVAGLLYYAIGALSQDTRRIQTMQQLEQTIHLATSASALIHELQKERGLSAGLLASKGTRFTGELSTQRSDTDTRLEAFRQQGLSGNAQDVGIASLRDAIERALTQLEQLPRTRDGINALRLTGGESFTYYTTSIEQLFSILSGMTAIDCTDCV